MLKHTPQTTRHVLRHGSSVAMARLGSWIKACAFVLAAFAVLVPGTTPAQSTAKKMVIVSGKDVSGEVFKRLGLPSQDYCWQQCLDEKRCTGTRWGVISGSTAGQCQLLTGELTLRPPAPIKTEDGTRIDVTASRKE
jgi:hypothetical protein